MNVREHIRASGSLAAARWARDTHSFCAQKGYQVIVTGRIGRTIEKGLGAIHLRLAESGDRDLVLSRIQGTIGFKRFAECDLVIEAATEKMEVKKKIFARARPGLPEGCDSCDKHLRPFNSRHGRCYTETGSGPGDSYEPPPVSICRDRPYAFDQPGSP